jgi:hypothetical protein
VFQPTAGSSPAPMSLKQQRIDRGKKIEEARAKGQARRAASADQPGPAPQDPVRLQPAEKQVRARCSGQVKGEKLIHVKVDKATGIKLGKSKSAMVLCPKYSTVTFEVTHPGSGETHLCHSCEEHAAAPTKSSRRNTSWR